MAFEFNNDNFENEVLKNDIPVLVDFWAPWCGPCRAIAPIIETLAEKYEGKILIGKINVDEAQSIAIKYGVMTIPTLIIFKNGEVFSKHTGSAGQSVFEEFINKAL